MWDLAIKTLLDADKIIKDSATLHYKLSGYLIENKEDDLAKRFLRKALKENFYLHKEILSEFPAMHQKTWVTKMIKDFSAKNKPL
jgi:hypothetical protein